MQPVRVQQMRMRMVLVIVCAGQLGLSRALATVWGDCAAMVEALQAIAWKSRG